MSERRWTHGNRLELLENGEAFFPSVFEGIRAAQREVLIETYIWFDDRVGRELQGHLIDAARRGVTVHVTVDGYGSMDLPEAFVRELAEAGVHFHVFGPVTPIVGRQTSLFRRLHRKLVAIDGQVAWIGGINYSDEQTRAFGAKSKQDYAVRVEGPAAVDIHAFCRAALGSPSGGRRSLRGLLRWLPREWARPSAGAQALLVARDNHDRRTAIEAMYRLGLRNAERDILIMNAYFFPGYRFLRAMRQAVERGVRVRLILQGEPDKAYVRFAAETLHDHLLKIGVEIWEYMERPSHAKVAVMGDEWATVGSSNLDPFSLSLNLEANLFIRDRDFAGALRDNLEGLIAEHCRQVTREDVVRRGPLRHLWRWVAYHLLRHFPRMANLIPVRQERLHTVQEAGERDTASS